MSNEDAHKKVLLPKSGTPVYALLNDDETKRSKTLKKWRLLNKIVVVPLYRARILPLFGFGKIFLIIETIGRISGKKRRTPVEYHRVNKVITVVSARGNNAGWIKNIQKNPSVCVRLGFRRFKPHIEILNSERDVLEFLHWYVLNCGKSAKMLFGWNPKYDTLESTDFSIMAKEMCVVKIQND